MITASRAYAPGPGPAIAASPSPAGFAAQAHRRGCCRPPRCCRARSLGDGRRRRLERSLLLRPRPAAARRPGDHRARWQRCTAENPHTGKYRSTFDVKLEAERHLPIALVNDSVFASYKQGGETNAGAAPPEASRRKCRPMPASCSSRKRKPRRDLRHHRQAQRAALKPTGKGLELVPVTHPNDLVRARRHTFRFCSTASPPPISR